MYAEPFNESALIIHWQPVQDTRDAMRGRLKGYKVQYNTHYYPRIIKVLNVYAEPFNESALTIHWQPVQDMREALRGRLKGYKVQYNTLITTLG